MAWMTDSNLSSGKTQHLPSKGALLLRTVRKNTVKGDDERSLAFRERIDRRSSCKTSSPVLFLPTASRNCLQVVLQRLQCTAQQVKALAEGTRKDVRNSAKSVADGPARKLQLLKDSCHTS